MENKHVGWLLIGIAVVVEVIIFLFNNATKTVLDNSCPIIAEGHACPAYSAINNLGYFGLVITGLLAMVGFFLILSKPKEKIIIKEVEKKEKSRKIDVSQLNSEEKKVIQLLSEHKAMFQSDLVEKSDIHKVKISRILDRLEGQGLIERKRRGMQNIVILSKVILEKIN